MDREFPAKNFQSLCGLAITAIEDSDADEGFTIYLDDGSELAFGFSGSEGWIEDSHEGQRD